MSYATFDSGKYPLLSLLQMIASGRMQLPDFQRSWVWDDEHIKDLLASVSVSYPIGAVMLLETGNEDVRFKPRAVEGVQLPDPPPSPERLILDGQQRLTSLFLALFSGQPVPTRNDRNAPVSRVYYIDMVKALDPNVDRKDAIIGLPDDRVRRNFRGEIEVDYSTPEKEYENLVFPVSQIFDAAGWRRGFSRHWAHAAEMVELFDRFEAEVIDRFKQYHLPVITMLKETPKEAVCQVFEKVNTGGVSLTVFELLTATYAADDFDLRRDWNARRETMRRLGMQEPPAETVLDAVESTDFLQAVTLLATRSRAEEAIANGVDPDRAPAITCKRKDVLRLTLEDYRRWADPAVAGFIRAAKLLHTQYIFKARDLPYRTQLVPLAAIAAVLGSDFDNAAVKQEVLRWYWAGVLGELYGAAIESRFARDLPEVLGWVRGGPEPSTVSEALFSPDRLDSLRSRNSAAYKGLYALLMRAGCRDLLSTESISHQTYFEQSIDIHHIFPKHWCEKRGIDWKRYDSIINKTPLSARTNRTIGGNAPSVYLPRLERQAGITASEMRGLLETHLIDYDLLSSDDFDGFMQARKERLLSLVEEAMGKPVQRDLAVVEAFNLDEEEEEVA